MNRWIRAGARWLAVALGIAVVGYATHVGVTWARYGDVAASDGEAADPLLDRFMPAYEIAERHQIRVAASEEITLDTARQLDLQAAPVVRTIIRAREVILRATPDHHPHPRGCLPKWSRSGGVCSPRSQDAKSSLVRLPGRGKRMSRS